MSPRRVAARRAPGSPPAAGSVTDHRGAPVLPSNAASVQLVGPVKNATTVSAAVDGGGGGPARMRCAVEAAAGPGVRGTVKFPPPPPPPPGVQAWMTSAGGALYGATR